MIKIINKFKNIQERHRKRAGLVYLFTQALVFSISNMLMKFSNLQGFQIINHVGVLMFLGNYYILKQLKISTYYKSKMTQKKLLTRGILGVLNFCCVVYSVKVLSLSEAITIIYTMPVFTGIFGAIFLKEPFRLIEILVSVCGISGVVFIFKPPFIIQYFDQEQLINPAIVQQEGVDEFLIFFGRIIALTSAILSAVVFLILRSFQSGEQINSLVPIQYFCSCEILIPPMFMMYQGIIMPSLTDIVLIFIIAILMYIGQVCMQMGLKIEKAGKASVFNYTIVVYSFLFDIFLFGHKVDNTNLIGIGLILSSAGFLFYKNWFQEEIKIISQKSSISIKI